MTLQQIYYALIVAECGSMNKAAKKLYIAQPTLSASIHALEEEVHVQIFNRTSQGIIITSEGKEFLQNARQLYQQFELLQDRYGGKTRPQQIFKVSTQHYSFATKAFVETIKKYGMEEFNLEICETKTKNVLEDVETGRSELGILYLSEHNRAYLTKLLQEKGLLFHHLVDAHAFVYLYRGHPLAQRTSISLEDLKEYPNMSFDQGEEGSVFFSEEILAERTYPQTIKVNDRATMLNLMRGLNGYTLCSGMICTELNGDDYVAIPYREDQMNPNAVMEIGWIVKEHQILSQIALNYIQELRTYCGAVERGEKE